jgi:hypothetical protein
VGHYASVRRFVRTLRGETTPDARVVIITAPGEDYGECGVMVSVRTLSWISATRPHLPELGLPIMIDPAHRDPSWNQEGGRDVLDVVLRRRTRSISTHSSQGSD